MPRTAATHSRLAKTFHWVFVAVLAYGVANPVDEVAELDDRSFLSQEIAFAVVFLLLLLARFTYMRLSRRGKPPGGTPGFLQRLATRVHLGMYLSLAMLALSGLAIGGLYASSIRNGPLLQTILWLHEACFWTSVILIALHIVGALYHRWLGDGVWSSMVPILKESRTGCAGEKSIP